MSYLPTSSPDLGVLHCRRVDDEKLAAAHRDALLEGDVLSHDAAHLNCKTNFSRDTVSPSPGRMWKDLTHRVRLCPLRLLQRAIYQLHIIQRCLPPPLRLQNLRNLFAQGRDVIGLVGEEQHRLRKQVRRRMDHSKRQRQLEHGRVVRLPFALHLGPIDGVVVTRHLFSLGRRLLLGGAPLFDHDVDERARLLQVLLHKAAVREEPVHQGAQEPGHKGELYRGQEGDDGVVLCDAQPVLVAAELIA